MKFRITDPTTPKRQLKTFFFRQTKRKLYSTLCYRWSFWCKRCVEQFAFVFVSIWHVTCAVEFDANCRTQLRKLVAELPDVPLVQYRERAKSVVLNIELVSLLSGLHVRRFRNNSRLSVCLSTCSADAAAAAAVARSSSARSHSYQTRRVDLLLGACFFSLCVELTARYVFGSDVRLSTRCRHYSCWCQIRQA